MAGTGEEVKLIGYWSSPFALRASIALHLKGVSYEHIEEEFANKSELLLKSNPIYKKIPVLLHNDKPISESMLIVEYVEDAWPSSGPALLPADPYDRAVARFWAHFIDDKWFPVMWGMIFAQSEAAVEEAVEQLRGGLLLLEAAFETCSKGKGFFNGDAVGYLDIALGSLVGWLKATEAATGCKILTEEKTPLLVGWVEHFCAEPTVKELMPETERIVEFREMCRVKLSPAK